MTKLIDYDKGNVITIKLESGETFEEVTVSYKDYDPAIDRHDLAGVTIDIEGPGVWEQVKDRVDNEVLHASQWSTKGERRWKEATLSGTVWVGNDEVSSTPEYKELGTIKSIKSIES